jgi:hypothetical protein
MKSGVIIYVAGSAPLDWTEDYEVHIRSSESEADLVEIITTKTGHFDVLDAWRDLLSKGMSLVTCKMAVFSESGEIEFTGRELRLCG